MRSKRLTYAATLVAAALLLGLGLLWRNPYALISGDFTRQRLMAGLSKASVGVGEDRWVYAYSDDAPDDAPTVVMLHGFTGSKENWYPVAQRLHGRYRVIVPDLPGWGESDRRAGADYGFVAQGERVMRFLHAVSGNRPVVLLGHSMGGGIAAVAAAGHPSSVSHLGLIDAAGVRFNDNRFGEEVLAGRNPFGVSNRPTLQRYLDTVFFDPKAQPWIPWPADDIYIARRREDAAFEQQVLDRIGRGDERFIPGEVARTIRQPTLLLWCRQDAVIDASALDLYAQRIPQARRVLLDGCGHMSIIEKPDAVAQAVVDLIEKGTRR
ncbi:alpha/beta hydrolase [Lysobacter sp. LF1]|uniref:Alpha/beta hydrolase n=1 Tax=Lysobacter stagni TaxID=3045172 RepID=A0ABT6XEE4_9GAMM|nr:alpha/beta hydrolase [Lysobacter sp. LF1]MDI9238512.1 alpha/beta hydrolase [Lysobacter sp. LF1]